MGVGGQRHAPADLPPGKDPIPIALKAKWAPGPVWKGAQDLTPTGFDARTVQPVASRYTGPFWGEGRGSINETTEYVDQSQVHSGRDLKQRAPAHKAGVPPTQS